MNDSMIDYRNSINDSKLDIKGPTDLADDFGLGKIQFLDFNGANDDV